jgi:alkylation response protein AidB-like acyl-CoA dehydrogenase
MDFGFSAEQEQLRTSVEDVLARRAPVTHARAMMDDAVGTTDALWREISQLGWPALTIAEEYGGVGLGWLELSLVMEAMGRVVFPGPFMSSACMGTPAIAVAGTAEQKQRLLPGLAAGSQRATLALAEASGEWSASAVAMVAEREGEGFSLSGTKMFVPDARSADLLVVAARVGEGVGLFAIPADAEGLRVDPLATIDRTRKLDLVALDGVRAEPDCLLGGAATADHVVDGLVELAGTMLAAESCGAAARALEMSVEYVRIREQFGRAIATFQALQHRLADMKVGLENSRSLSYYAAWSFDDRDEDARLPAAMAKAYAGETCMKIVADAIQVHGGVGFTWEHDLHLYFKRAKSNELMLGDGVHRRARVADLLEL